MMPAETPQRLALKRARAAGREDAGGSIYFQDSRGPRPGLEPVDCGFLELRGIKRRAGEG